MTRVRLILFDLDETLVHATEVPLPYPHAFEVVDTELLGVIERLKAMTEMQPTAG